MKKQLTVIAIMALLAAVPAVESKEIISKKARKEKPAKKAKGDKGSAPENSVPKTPEQLIAEATEKAYLRFEAHGEGPNGFEGYMRNIYTTSALGLLAKGESVYAKSPIDGKKIDVLQAYARSQSMAAEKIDIIENRLYPTIDAALLGIFLSEYHLITKDKKVLPGIKALSTYIALGVSGVGTWGAELRDVEANGLYGKAVGKATNDALGEENLITLNAAISLALAKKCGVETKATTKALTLATDYLRYYVYKGAIPVYNYKPNDKSFNGSNRSALAAIFFNIIGDKEAAKYFTRLTLASEGHGGYYQVGQTNPNKHFLRIFRVGAGEPGDKLLELCHSRRKLYITGKTGLPISLLSKKEIEESVAAGTFKAKKASDDELVAALKNWSHLVRFNAAKEIKKRKLNIDSTLISMLKSDDPYAQYGACAGYRYLPKSEEVAVILKDILQSSNDEVLLYFSLDIMGRRYKTRMTAGKEWADIVKKHLSSYVKVATRSYPGKDPYNRIGVQFAERLMREIHRLEFTELFHSAKEIKDSLTLEEKKELAKALLSSHYASARAVGLQICDHMSEADAEPLYEDMYIAIVSNYGGSGNNEWQFKQECYPILGRKRFKEALDLTFQYADEDDGEPSWGFKTLAAFNYNCLEPHWDRIEPMLNRFLSHSKHEGHVAGWLRGWQRVFAEKDVKIELRSIEPFLTKEGRAKLKPLMPKDLE